MDSLTLKCHNSFQKQNTRKATQSFAPRSLIFKLQQKVQKFNGIWVSWSSPKIDSNTNFLKCVTFLIAIFKKIFGIPLLINLFISLNQLNNIH